MRHMHRVLFALTAVAVTGCLEGLDPPAATELVFIEGTLDDQPFMMGNTDPDPCGIVKSSFLDCEATLVSESIPHPVAVKSFCVAVNETTIMQYFHCVERGECSDPNPTNSGIRGLDGGHYINRYYRDQKTYGDYPVSGVSPKQAADYCASKGGRLLTEIEWEYVATSRGTRQTVWSTEQVGDIDLRARVEVDCTGSNGKLAIGRCVTTVLPVGIASYDVTEDGVHDMAGNVSEWVADEFSFLAYCENQEGYKVVRNGSDRKLIFDGIPPALQSTTACVESCTHTYTTCRSTCDLAFGSSEANELEVSVDRRREWLTRTCVAAYKDQVTVPAVVGITPPFDCDPTDPEWCDGDADLCRDFCDCLEGEVPGVAFNGGSCNLECVAEQTACINDPGCAPNVAVVCDIESKLPTAWCVPRNTTDPDGIDSRHIVQNLPDNLAFHEGKKTWVVRGGNVTNELLCEARPTRRRERSIGDSVVGFRCAFDPTNNRECPEL